MPDMDLDGVTNPKRVIEKREKSAGDDKGEVGKSWNDTFTPTMSQAQFSKYPKKGKSTPPAELLKKHDAKN